MKPLRFDRDFVWGSLFVICVALFLLSHPTYISSDGTRYLIGAKFIAAGKGYAAYGFDSLEIIPQIQWPPLLSFFIALVMKITGWNEIYSLRLVNFAALMLYYFSFYYFITLLFVRGIFHALAHFMIILSPAVWPYLNMVLTEPLFMGFLGIFLCVFLKATQSENKIHRLTLFSFSGLLLTLMCLTRQIALPITISCILFLSLVKNAHPLRQRLIEISSLSIPILMGTGWWFLRNKMLTGHFTFLEEFPSRPMFEEIVSVEANFIRLVLEFIMGFSTYKWPQNWIIFIPTLIFLIGFLIVAVTIGIRKREIFHQKTGHHFIVLSCSIVFVYLLALNIFRLKNAFGENPRYYTSLYPLIYLSALLMVRNLCLRPSPLYRRLSFASVLLLCLFLCLGVAFHSINLLKSLVDTVRRSDAVVAGASFPGFKDSLWVYQLLGKEIQDEDILISNNPTFLSYVGARACRTSWGWDGPQPRGFKGVDKPHVALQEMQGKPGDIYVILEKKFPCFPDGGQDWRSYLARLNYEIVREDESSIAVRLLKT